MSTIIQGSMNGGAVANSLFEHPDIYHVRALTRNAEKPAARALAERGAELYCADLSSGRDALATAFSGADVIFALTDFWQTQSTDIEIAQGKAIADAAAQTPTLKHLLWSALPDPVALSGGKFLNYAELWAKTTTILFPNYFENCLTTPDRYLPTKDASGIYTLSFPHSLDTVMPNVAIADTGKLVLSILAAGSHYFEKTIAFYSQALSEADKLATIRKSTLLHHPSCSRLIHKIGYNVPTQYRKLTSSEFQEMLQARDGMSEEIALDFAEQLMIFEECGNVYANEEFVQAYEIPGLKLQTWAEFLDKHELPLKP
ncbi:NAD(P)-binding protein [Aspergillus steynii IBT 23096]|uniref:NAD(P)-binding protein n=1 Tax=Aspergillus steynii IBT 23096 TaxID=1392250 RepID=A0A2I2FT71_9EURO|nr:NAD(P)-binding protein [Aspergillus steynii IBT 23096]PLB43829.1 NAD(P)-binding protein [Aspergillus steynii IBT 23096]